MSLDERLLDIFKKNSIKTVITIPCKLLAPLIERFKSEPSIRLISPAREEEGLGISAGCYLGGTRSILLIQNSGLGNMVNAIKSLNQYYNIPFFAIVSHRGGKDEKIDAQRPMGELTPDLLQLLGIKYEILKSPKQVDDIDKALQESFDKKKSRVILTQPSFWR